MLLHLTELSSEPMHLQISRQIMDKIIGGDLAGGAEMVSIRKLARKQHVSIHTIMRAYDELRREGFIHAKGGERFFITPMTPEEKESLSMQRRWNRTIPLNIVESFSKQLISVFDPEKLRTIVARNISRHLHTRDVHFIILDESSNAYDLLPSDNYPDTYEILPDDPMLEAIRKKKYPFKIETITVTLKTSGLMKELTRRDARFILPLNEADHLLGFLALTGKKDQSPYSREEINLLTFLENQFVTAMTTARFYVEVLEKRRLEEEVTAARQIQADLLPKKLPQDTQMAVSAYIQPSHTIGGDFYDVVPIDDNRYGLVIADASGKGLPAAMLISQIQALLRSELRNGNTVQRILYDVNNQVFTSTPRDKFITLFFSIFNKQTRFIQFVNAGHNCPIVVCHNGKIKHLHTGGPGLGLLKNAIFETGRIRLDSGDTVCFYTDGITETMNAEQEEYGEHRLEDVLIRCREKNTSETIEVVLDDLSRFQNGNTGQDDRTMFVLKVDPRD